MGPDNPLLLVGMIIPIDGAAKGWRDDHRVVHVAKTLGAFVIKYAPGLVNSWW
jgi:hypothetical protein